MEKTVHKGPLTDLMAVVFRDGMEVHVNLPGNIAAADYRDDVIVRWIDETFKDVRLIEFDIPRQGLDEAFGIHIHPTVHDAYDIFFPGKQPIYDEMPDDVIEWVDEFLSRVKNVDTWCGQEEEVEV